MRRRSRPRRRRTRRRTWRAACAATCASRSSRAKVGRAWSACSPSLRSSCASLVRPHPSSPCSSARTLPLTSRRPARSGRSKHGDPAVHDAVLHLTPLCNKEGKVEALVAVCVVSLARSLAQRPAHPAADSCVPLFSRAGSVKEDLLRARAGTERLSRRGRASSSCSSRDETLVAFSHSRSRAPRTERL